jgi:integrase/recombinase XerD
VSGDSEQILEAFAVDCRLRGLARPDSQVAYARKFVAGLGNISPAHAGRMELRAFLSQLQSQGLKQSSIAKIFSQLSPFFDFMVEDGLMAANPVPPFKKRYLKAYKEQNSQDIRQLISIEDAGRLVNSILDSRDRAIVLLFLKTGMRLNELLALDVCDVDMLKMEIRLKPTKKRSNRLLFFDHETEEGLRAWLVARKNRNILGGPAMFPSRQGPRLTARGAENVIERHATRVGLHDPGSERLDKRFSPHCCRHWFSTYLYRSGMEERYIAWLRGDAPRGGIAPYIHINPEDVRRAYLAHIPQLGI